MTIRGFIHRLSGVAIVFLGDITSFTDLYPKRQANPGGYASKMKDAKILGDIEEQPLHQSPRPGDQDGPVQFQGEVEYLALIWGTFVMTVTVSSLVRGGVAEVFPEMTYDAARGRPLLRAILASLAILVWHFYSVLLDPISIR